MDGKGLKYRIYVASYKRPQLAKTHKYLREIVYVVMESEEEEYKKLGVKVWAIPDEVQGNLARVWNYILDNAKEKNIVLMDDDINYFGRWNGNKDKRLKEEDVYQMIQEGMLLATDLGVKYWGVNCLKDKGAYREYTPFGTVHYIGGPFQAHMDNPLRYDEALFLKEDYDMTLQVLNEYRKNLRLNMYHYVCEQNTLHGGVAAYRNVDTEMEQNKRLQRKWGKRIIAFDKSNKSGKEKEYDINPILKIPIKGV